VDIRILVAVTVLGVLGTAVIIYFALENNVTEKDRIDNLLAGAHFYKNNETLSIAISSGGNFDAKSFFKNGGRSWLSITPSYNEMNATIGSTIQLPVTLTHVASTDPLTIVTVRYTGIQSYIIPNCASAIPQIPSEVISFDSNTQQSDEVSLNAGESKRIVLNMTIPQDWPKCVNNFPIPWHLGFVDLDNLDPKDFLMDNTIVSIRVVG